MKKIFAWIWYSSADPEKVSTTIKSFGAFIPTIVIFLSLLHVNVSTDSLMGVIDAIALVASGILTVIAAAGVFVGAIRKIVTTIAGTNAVLNK